MNWQGGPKEMQIKQVTIFRILKKRNLSFKRPRRKFMLRSQTANKTKLL